MSVVWIPGPIRGPPKQMCNAKSKCPDAKSKLSRSADIPSANPRSNLKRNRNTTVTLRNERRHTSRQPNQVSHGKGRASDHPHPRCSVSFPSRPARPVIISVPRRHTHESYPPPCQSAAVRIFTRTVGMVTDGTCHLRLHERHRSSLITQSHLPITSYVRAAQLYFHPWNHVHAR